MNDGIIRNGRNCYGIVICNIFNFYHANFPKANYGCDLLWNFGEYDYFEAASIYDEHDYKHEGDFTLVYYIRKNEDNLDDLIKQIVQENNSIYKRYQLNEIDVVYETNGIYYICEKGR